MIKRSTWIILVIFVTLTGVVLIYQREKESELKDEGLGMFGEFEQPNSVKPVFQIPTGEVILGLYLEDVAGRSLEIDRENPEVEWMFGSQDGDVDQDRINQILYQIESLAINQELDSAIDFEMIGLIEPAYKLRISISNGGVFTLLIGNVTITNTSYYAQLTGSNPIVIDRYSLDGMINLLDNPPVLEFVQTTPVIEEGK